MFKDTIKGLDKLFDTDIAPPKIILVTGPPGSMKTTFVYSIINKYVEKTGKFGLYATVEETVESNLESIESIGIEPSFNLQVSDFSELREEDEDIDYLKFTEKMVTHYKNKHGDKFVCFAFDSLGALYSLIDQENIRKKMYYFFKMLREKNLISFIIMERSVEGESQLLGNEGFLSDGIFLLGLKRKKQRLVRYLQIEKMRATKHSMEAHALEITDDDIIVLGPIMG